MTSVSTEQPKTLGRYRLLDQLATGGMAVVHLAIEHGSHGLERPVVIKQLQASHDDESSQRMLLQEARLAARINHPNVVEIHELGTDGHRPFIAMEFVPGAQLREIGKASQEQGDPVPIGVAVGILLQACAGAHAAHELKGPDGQAENLVHRDLSPHNLMVGLGGHVKVLDFGVAKAEFNPEKTQTGVLKGKYAYMSPEQLEANPLDRRSDLFTLATVLWELLVGRPLFHKMSAIRTIHSVLNSEIPLVHTLRTEVPESVSEVVAKCLERDPEARYQSADEFRKALQTASVVEGLDTSTDAISDFVGALVGAMVAERQDWVDTRVDRALRTETDLDATTVKELPEPEVRQSSIHSVSTVYEEPGEKKSSRRGRWAGFGVVGLVAVMAGVHFVMKPALEGPPVRISLAPTMDSDLILEGWDPIRLYLQEELGRPVELVVADSYTHTAELLISGEVDIASLPPTTYVDTRAAHPDLNLLMVAEHDQMDEYGGVLVVRVDSGIQTLDDLAGKKICYVHENSTTGYLLPRIFLEKNGYDSDSLFAEEFMLGDHGAALQGLSDGICDVAATTQDFHHASGALGSSREGIRLFESTGHLPNDAICAAPGADPELVDTIRDLLLNLDPDEDLGVSSVGEVEKITGFAHTSDSEYEELRRDLELIER